MRDAKTVIVDLTLVSSTPFRPGGGRSHRHIDRLVSGGHQIRLRGTAPYDQRNRDERERDAHALPRREPLA